MLLSHLNWYIIALKRCRFQLIVHFLLDSAKCFFFFILNESSLQSPERTCHPFYLPLTSLILMCGRLTEQSSIGSNIWTSDLEWTALMRLEVSLGAGFECVCFHPPAPAAMPVPCCHAFLPWPTLVLSRTRHQNKLLLPPAKINSSFH